MLSLLLQ